MEYKRKRFLENLKKARGIICMACENTGITQSTYYRWCEADREFKEKVEDIKESQIDYVENKLLRLIENGDTTATIFYLKTKGKKRGYSEKVQPAEQQPVIVQDPAKLLPDNTADGRLVEKRIKNKKNYIVKILKKQGKYTAELTYQVDITAQLLVRADILADEIFDKHHRVINVEYSREGNERESINPKEKLYLDVLRQGQKALRALGMNTESKERKTDNDGFSDFMNTFKDGDTE